MIIIFTVSHLTSTKFIFKAISKYSIFKFHTFLLFTIVNFYSKQLLFIPLSQNNFNSHTTAWILISCCCKHNFELTFFDEPLSEYPNSSTNMLGDSIGRQTFHFEKIEDM